MKLEKNMYVRTDREIFKFLKVDEKGTYRRTLSSDNESVTTGFEIEDVKKASYNIIDLIEVSDYVNGFKITEIVNGVTKCLKTEYRLNLNYVYFCFYEKDIKSIITKEQFESMSYKVEG